MARNPRPNLILNLTLTLTVFILHLPSLASSLSPSPSPSPNPPPHIPFSKYKPNSSTGNPVNNSSIDRRQPSLDTIVNRAPIDHRQPDKVRNKRELNFGEKLGVSFAIVAGAMQFVFVGFLAIKRWQLGRIERRFRERDRDSSDQLV